MSESGSRARGRAGGQPIVVLSGDSERVQGKDAQQSNITAAKAIAESVRTTLGPKGMDKMLVDDTGEVVITNDGVTILEEMDIEHPAAQMLVEVAQTQESEVGDGTTTATVLAGKLLAEAEDLLDEDVHPRTVIEGYVEARDVAVEAVDDQVLDVDVDDDVLRQVAESSMTGKGTGAVTADQLAEAVVAAVRKVQRDGEVDRDDLRVVTRVGESSGATRVVNGVIAEEDPVHENMPRSVEDATVAVLDGGLEKRETEVDVEFNIESTDQLTAALEAEEEEFEGYARTLADADVDVLFATDDIADRAAAHLADAGILAFDDVGGYSDDDEVAIARTTGAQLIGTVENLDPDNLGHADSVRLEKFGEDQFVFVENSDAETVTLFVRGGTEHVTDELERATTDALDVVATALSKGGVVPGAAGTEIAVAEAIRDRAAGVEGRKQLAVEAFADALDALPRTLAENAGMDQIDALVDLRARYDAEGRTGIITNESGGEVADPVEHGVLDPAEVKREAVESATEAATMIVRIDDVISANSD